MIPLPFDTRAGVVHLAPDAIRELTPDGVLLLRAGGGYQLAGRRAIADAQRALHIARNEQWRARHA